MIVKKDITVLFQLEPPPCCVSELALHYVEFGILNGFSLKIWLERSPEKTSVEAYDLFKGPRGE